jgi:hypothetical protein
MRVGQTPPTEILTMIIAGDVCAACERLSRGVCAPAVFPRQLAHAPGRPAHASFGWLFQRRRWHAPDAREPGSTTVIKLSALAACFLGENGDCHIVRHGATCAGHERELGLARLAHSKLMQLRG